MKGALVRKNVAVLVLFASLFAVSARADKFGMADPSRWSLSASSGWLGFQNYGGGTAWQGVDIAPAVTFSAHQSLALTGNIAHGIPFNSENGHRTIARVQAQLRLYPPLGVLAGPVGLFASAGPSWMGEKSLREWSGLNTQLSATRAVAHHLVLFGMYSHGFAWDAAQGDRDFFRIGLDAGSPLGR